MWRLVFHTTASTFGLSGRGASALGWVLLPMDAALSRATDYMGSLRVPSLLGWVLLPLRGYCERFGASRGAQGLQARAGMCRGTGLVHERRLVRSI